MPSELSQPTESSENMMASRANQVDCAAPRPDYSEIQSWLTGNHDRQLNHVFGKSARGGAIYRWGCAVASGGAIDPLFVALSKLACQKTKSKGAGPELDIRSAADTFADSANSRALITTIDSSKAVVWAAALPALTLHLEEDRWWRLVSSLIQYRESILQRSHFSFPSHLLLGGELGLTLIRIAGFLPSCAALEPSAITAIAQWSDEPTESLTGAIEKPSDARLVLASVIRTKALLKTLGKETKQLVQAVNLMGDQLATWVAAMTIHTGSSAFSNAQSHDAIDDLGPHGLLAQAARFDRDSLPTAISVALGKKPDGGRLSWQVNLPETIHHDEQAKIAILMADWDVRRARTHLDYSGDQCRIEVFSGRTKVISGDWQTLIQVDGIEQQPASDWSEVCEHSDDDVHYLEIDQHWTGGMVLERQIMLVRDDRCLYIADAVLPEDTTDKRTRNIKYASRLPIAASVDTEELADTRELFLQKQSRSSRKNPKPQKPLALVIPLSASEWRVGPTNASLRQTEDNHLLLSTEGNGRLCAPIWMDFQKRRFNRPRTWRNLTVAENLRTCKPNEAVGYRVQAGSEQWMIYRSLTESTSRTVLGKHLIADFFSSRFDTGDGGHEVLLKVDDNEANDDE